MKKIIIFFLFLCACSNFAINYRENAQGYYRLISDPSVIVSIDNTGSLSTTSGITMFFEQAVSDTEAIYTHKENGTKYYIPIKVEKGILYGNPKKTSRNDVSFQNMTAFATETDSPFS